MSEDVPFIHGLEHCSLDLIEIVEATDGERTDVRDFTV